MVATQSEALQFRDSLAAWNFCATRKIFDVEIFLLFNEPQDEVASRWSSRSDSDVPMPGGSLN
jgi:hypothetical protein